MNDWIKISKSRQERLNKIYEIEEDWSVYARYCKACPGVWKELLGFDEKRALGIQRESEVWRCPSCQEITSAIGSVSEQTSGFSAYNTFSSGEPIDEKNNFDAVDKIKEDRDRTKR